MPFSSGWVGALSYNPERKAHQFRYCSSSLGLCLSTEEWFFYGSPEEELELHHFLSFERPQKTRIRPQESIHSSMSSEEYCDAIEKTKQEIAKGNVYQINLSYQLSGFAIENPLILWWELCHRNPARHAYYWQTETEIIICNSPELFLRIKDGTIESCPIKGTNPSIVHINDYQELWLSEKEESELTMIVDMMRNDLAKITIPHSVFVENRKIRRCGDLLHTEQRVLGRLSEECSISDVFNACFPPASVTGAPKISALKLIEQLEKHERNWYTGSLGFVDDRGHSEWNVCIRSIVIEEGLASIFIGAGIVYDSDPQKEWLETQAKAQALLNVLADVERVNME